jgi:hypothetical protein
VIKGNIYEQYYIFKGCLAISALKVELIKVADLFGTSIDYLVDRTDEKKPYPSKR